MSALHALQGLGFASSRGTDTKAPKRPEDAEGVFKGSFVKASKQAQDEPQARTTAAHRRGDRGLGGSDRSWDSCSRWGPGVWGEERDGVGRDSGLGRSQGLADGRERGHDVVEARHGRDADSERSRRRGSSGERGSRRQRSRSRSWERGHSSHGGRDNGPRGGAGVKAGRSDDSGGRGRASSSSKATAGKAPPARGPTEAELADLIPGFRRMGPAERLKARTRLALQQVGSAIRKGGGSDDDDEDDSRGKATATATRPAASTHQREGQALEEGEGQQRSWGRFVTTKSEAYQDEWSLRNGGAEEKPQPGCADGGTAPDADADIGPELRQQVKPLSKAQVRRERNHESAIFGWADEAPALPPVSAGTRRAERGSEKGGRVREGREGGRKEVGRGCTSPPVVLQSGVGERLAVAVEDEDAPVVVPEEDLLPRPDTSGLGGGAGEGGSEAHCMAGTLAGAVIARQQHGSWRDRARSRNGPVAGA